MLEADSMYSTIAVTLIRSHILIAVCYTLKTKQTSNVMKRDPSDKSIGI